MSAEEHRLLYVSPFRAGLLLGVLFGLYALLIIAVGKVFLLLNVARGEIELPNQFLLLSIALNSALGFFIGTIGSWAFNLLAEYTGGLKVRIAKEQP